ncbi:aminopeptidase a/i [Bacillus sp. OxB-1]|uniref:leucyl aminopeptidase family protein n=1 Tax=Bacillus sp. (strain OxB-1) TaxID=98228 RepID=UPI00058204EF|nr:leucyl aminopeptidase family protein [Bacillus sp. OxB-1]BAQ12033.1 aminopeptidase a/i [Bacillus sp. OxB-1]
MTNAVRIMYQDDATIQKNDAVKRFVANQPGDHCSLFFGDAHYVVIKKIANPSLEKIRNLAGNISRNVSASKVGIAKLEEASLTALFPSSEKGDLLTAFVEGWELGAYQFTRYQSDITPFQTELELSGEGVEPFVATGKIRAEAVTFSRDLMNEVPNVLHPEAFPEVLKLHFKETDVEVDVWDEGKIRQAEMNGVLTVCRGSKYQPRFVELIYQGDASKPLVALVGKGVTFDTGGISLKSGKDISDMRMDMGGAAAVAGAMSLLAKSKARVNVVALIPIVENMPDNQSVLPGEVIHYKNGLTVQVGNTDAEGRLILADGLIRAGERQAEYIVDIATLTGAIVNALGTEIGGVFGDEELSATMKRIGDRNGDFIWPMPLIESYDQSLSSDYADMNNISSMSEAGSITAALFLRRFVPDGAKWLHVDMAGVMDKSKASGYYTKSATGYGARLLADYTAELSK